MNKPLNSFIDDKGLGVFRGLKSMNTKTNTAESVSSNHATGIGPFLVDR